MDLVLVVEDDPEIAELVQLYLSRHGFAVHVTHDGEDGLAAAARLRPVACVVDIALPGIDGIEVCRRLRAAGDRTPVLFLTARDDEADRIVGLELGADDYVTKPFSPRELVARVRAVLRRTGGRPESPAAGTTHTIGPVTIDVPRRRVTVAGVPATLTSTELDLLGHLMSQPGRVFTRGQLLAAVWGYPEHAGTRTVDVHIAQIRAKLGAAASIIRTVRGFGYAADGPVDA